MHFGMKKTKLPLFADEKTFKAGNWKAFTF